MALDRAFLWSLVVAGTVVAGTMSALAQNPATTVIVTTQSNRHAINRNIYGVSIVGDPTEAKDIKALNDPNDRIGGDLLSTYNWDVAAHAPAGMKLPSGDAYNLSSDWYWESYLVSTSPGGLAASVITAAKTAGVGTQTIQTIPMTPYIATVGPDATTSAASLWSFSIKKYGPQVGNSCSSSDYPGGNGYAYDEWQPDAGSGIASMNGCTPNYVKNNEPSDAYVKNSPAIHQAYVSYLVKKYGGAAHGGIQYYILDNEPSIWSSTHRDTHPDAETYNELWEDIKAYAEAIRAADPDATIIGPEEWSWWAMWKSGNDQQNLSPSDYATHNNTYYYPWLLQQLAAYKKKNGVSLIDLLSVHCYDDGGAPPNVATRKLWDPNYQDPGWYGELGLNEGIVEWIPLMQEWVAEYDPGMPIACTEYAVWDNDTTLSGAVTQADLLGIFGYYGYSLASRFGVPGYPAYLAFQIYTNYDGKNSGFGDTSVQTAVADPDNLSAFSAVRSSDGALTVMVINKQKGATPVTVLLPDFLPGAKATMYQITSAGQKSIGAPTSVTVGGNGIVQTLPGPSVTLFVIPAGTVTKAPSTPTGLAATVGNRSVTLSWNLSVGASTYNIYRAVSASGPFSRVASVPSAAGNTESWTDTSVTNGVTYYYEIAAANKLGQSPNSTPPVAATPQVPPVFSSSATASPNPVAQNIATTIQATVKCTSGSLTSGVVEILALDPTNKVALTTPFTGQSFTAGQSRSYSTTFFPADEGTYTLEVAVLSAAGQQWSLNAKAGTLSVNSGLSFTSTAAAPGILAVGTKGTITVVVTNTGSADLTNGNVLIQIYSPSGATVAGSNPSSVDLAAGASQTYTMTWTPTASDVNGTYSVDVGVFNGAWTTDYYWNTDATIQVTPSVNSGLSFTSTAVAPGILAVGTKGTITVVVTNTGSANLTNGNVLIQIYSPSGATVAGSNPSSVDLAAGAKKTYTMTWMPTASDVNGTYSVDVGVFNGAWTTDYYWNTDATIQVGG